MPALRIIFLNGTINSGKSTVGRCLAALLPQGHFVDGDDHAAQDAPDLVSHIAAALARIETCIENADGDLVIAYPLRDVDYLRVRKAAQRRHALLHVVTLAPPIEVALANRGTRLLSDDERARICEMYEEGYASRSFSDVVINNADASPEQSAQTIARHLLLI